MNMEEYLRALENHVASHKLNLGDGESVLSLLYEAYGDINPMYEDQIKADFVELYQTLNRMDSRMVFRLEYDWRWKERLRNRSLPQNASALSMSRGIKLNGPRGNRYHSGEPLNKSFAAEQRLCRMSSYTLSIKS